MKKINFIVLASAVMLMPVSASAQKLGSLLKKAVSSDVVNNVINAYVPGANSVSLPGTWTYTGAAVSVSGDNTISDIAGSAVTSGIEEKADSYLQKIGIRQGAVSFTFNEDKTFTCTVFGMNLNGTWQINDDAKRLTPVRKSHEISVNDRNIDQNSGRLRDAFRCRQIPYIHQDCIVLCRQELIFRKLPFRTYKFIQRHETRIQTGTQVTDSPI